MSEYKLREAIETAITRGHSRMAGRQNGPAIVADSLCTLQDRLTDRDPGNDYVTYGMDSLQVRTKVVRAAKRMEPYRAADIINEYVACGRRGDIDSETKIEVSEVESGTSPGDIAVQGGVPDTSQVRPQRSVV